MMLPYEYARRVRSGTKWHLIESHIADRAVTRCGHEMPEHDAKGRTLETVYVIPTGATCLLCFDG